MFDGHIGSDASDMASSVFLDKFLLKNYGAQASNYMEFLKSSLVETIEDIDAEFSKVAVERKLRSGCTAVVALIYNHHVLVASVGDSNAFLCSRNMQSHEAGAASLVGLLAKKLTRDHNAYRLDERARVEASGGRFTPNYVPLLMGYFPMTRAIGDVPLKRRLIDFGSAVNDISKEFLYGMNGPTSLEQYILTMPPEAILDNYWETYPLDTMYDSWTVGQTILEFVLGTPDVFVPTTYEAFETLQEVEKLNLYHISRTRLEGMAEQCIEFPPFSERVVKRMKTCSEEGYAMYIKERDPLNLGFPDVELLRLVRGLLNGDRDARMSVDEAIAHPYFTGQSSSFNYFGAVVMLMLCLITIYVARIVLEKVHQP